MRFLTCDPGTSNFAYSALDLSIKRGVLVCRLLASGFVSPTVANLTHNQNHKIAKRRHAAVDEELPAFAAEITRILDEYQPVWVGTERFQRRPGGGGGLLAESIGMMNGILLREATVRDIRWTLYIASAWKNWLNDLGTAAGQPTLLAHLYRVGSLRGLASHTVDTIGMAAYLHSGDPKHVPYYTPNALINIVRGVKLHEATALPSHQRARLSPVPGAQLPRKSSAQQPAGQLRPRTRGTKSHHPRRRP